MHLTKENTRLFLPELNDIQYKCLNDLHIRIEQEAVVRAMLKLKEEMKQHTVPEGWGLITRSYLNASIDFIVNEAHKKVKETL